MSDLNFYRELKMELDKTAVISKEFKNQILGYASAIAGQAYERGVAEERERQEKLREQPES